jgi:hypothetical protein
MSSRARSPSIESVSEISLHPDDVMYNNLDFLEAEVQSRSPSATHISPTRSRRHGFFTRSVSANNRRGAYGDFDMRSEYRASRDRSPLRRPSPIDQRGQFRGPVGHFDDRYGRDPFFDADRRDYRG